MAMIVRRKSTCHLAVWLAVVGGCLVAQARVLQLFVTEQDVRAISGARRVVAPGGERIVTTSLSLADLLTDVAVGPWAPATERPRGAVLENIYREHGPAVVVVRTDDGHGSGFLIGSEPLVMTNAHVIREGLRVDVTRQASYVHVHTGRIGANGAMAAAASGTRAYVVKIDADRDLALLRMDAQASGASPAPLTLASRAPIPGSDCVIIGHPAAGMLWTIRSGQVTSVGRAPRDLIDAAIARLALGPEHRADLERQLSSLPSFAMFLSSAGANPGDSGGPVLNEEGRVVGVTFAIPADVGERRFTYHIALDELRDFLAAVPAQTMLVVPDAWALGAGLSLVDLTADGRPDAIVDRSEGQGMRLLVDLDGNAIVPGDDEHFLRLVRGRAWDAEFALHLAGESSHAFYDGDNDGQFETILAGDASSNAARLRFTRSGGRWRASEVTTALLAPDPLRDPHQARQLGRVLSGLAAASRR